MNFYHIQDDKIYEMSLNEPMKKIGVVASDETIMNIIDWRLLHERNNME